MIKAEEKRIRKLVKQNNDAKLAFNKMYEYYEIMDKIQSTTHLMLIKYIYTGNPNEFDNISLAAIANIAEGTCYKYRKKYIDCFFLCFEMIISK